MYVRPATLAALLFSALALLFAACGDDEPAGESGAQSAATQEAGSGAEPEAEEAEQEGEEGESEEEREREEQEARENGGKACTEVGDIDGEPKDQPPADVTILDGAKVYESEGPFGKTERFFAAIDGEAAELAEKRDAAAAALEGSGYKILATDQEEGTEAEAHLEGDGKTVDIQVITLCEGKLRIRYTVS
jgi:hypothetical protein